MSFQVEVYQTADGKRPFAEWLRSVKDRRARAKVRTRITRLELGNHGNCKSIGGGLLELRVDYGPGYRVYLARRGALLMLLLCGGDKRTQQRDIEQARAYLTDYERRTQP